MSAVAFGLMSAVACGIVGPGLRGEDLEGEELCWGLQVGQERSHVRVGVPQPRQVGSARWRAVFVSLNDMFDAVLWRKAI